MKMSEENEALIVAAGTTLEFIAGGIATSTLPNEAKLIIAPILALAGGAVLTFWKVFVNTKKEVCKQ